MADIYFISDTHLSHNNILTFRTDTPNGELIRPGFENIEHMNETIIENWNKVVKPSDKIYHLGDVALGNVKDFHNIMRRLNGKKRLILGNHDKFDLPVYMKYFQKISSWRSFGEFEKKFVACHYPLHHHAFQYRKGSPGWCVHGHIHEKLVRINTDKELRPIGMPDSRYINVCVEHRNYTPVHLDTLLSEMRR